VRLLGQWIEMRSVLGASRALEALTRLMPTEAHKVMADGSMQDVPLDQLQPGDRVQVRPGEKIPANGVIVEGHSTADEALLTGESVPLEKQVGDAVIGGAAGGEGSLIIEVQKTSAENHALAGDRAGEPGPRNQIAHAIAWPTGPPAGSPWWPWATALPAMVVWTLVVGRPIDFALSAHGYGHGDRLLACAGAGLLPLVVAVSTRLGATRIAHFSPQGLRSRRQPAGGDLRQDRHAH
jgi:Cu2+-exporting ATPase